MLKRVSIQNFKSLKDVTLDLQKINLLIGPNNSGKTNFLKALEYIVKDNTNQDEPEYKRLVFSLNQGQKIELELIYSPDAQENDDITFTCVVAQNAIIEKSKGRIRGVQNYSGTRLHFNPEDFKNITGPIIIYRPDTNKIDKPGPVGQGTNNLYADASNLIAFFDYIRDEKPQAFAQIKSDLAKCVPEFTEINFQSVKPTDEQLKIYGPATYKRIGLTNKQLNTIYWADELSEGTLYFIALLCIINQPNPPKLLLLEEPEKGIHPRRIYEVMQFIFGLVDDKDIQVIMTTHSPTVVDMFKDMPESVFIFDKDEEGATYIKNLQKDIIEPETIESEQLGIDPPQYLNGLGQAWKVGFIGGVPR